MAPTYLNPFTGRGFPKECQNTLFFKVRQKSKIRVLDAPRGFEPRLTDSESVVLPLYDGAKEGLLYILIPPIVNRRCFRKAGNRVRRGYGQNLRSQKPLQRQESKRQDRPGQEGFLHPLAAAPAERPLRGRGAAARLPHPGRFQADRDR